MKKRFLIPLRFKILIALLFVVTAVVSIITFTMAHLFHADKKAYVTDMASVIAIHTAEEAQLILAGYNDQLLAIAHLIEDQEIPQDRKTGLMKELFGEFQGFVAISLYENGEEVATIYDSQRLSEAALEPGDLQRYTAGNPLPLDEISRGAPLVENSTISEQLPTLTLATAHTGDGGTASIVLAAVISLEGLRDLGGRSQAFEIVLVDKQGLLLSHADPQLVAARTKLDWLPDIEPGSLAITQEYVRNDVEMLGAFAPLNIGGVVAAAQVPKASAYFASRELLNNLVLVALALLITSAAASMFWSRHITSSIGRLVEATRQVAEGTFEVNVRVNSSDEIGVLADSFNHMATELDERERALKEAQGQLIQSEKMAAFGQLGAGFAHEIKNPLAGILGMIQLSLRQAKEEHPLRPGLIMMENETKRCKGIIDNLLKFARQEKVLHESIDLGSVVENSVAIMHHQLGLHKVALSMDVKPDLPPVAGNANQLQQVLMNLILNAQQAIEGEPGKVVVTLDKVDGKLLELRVIDDGPGIPKDIQKKIFEPFYSTKPTGKGTGLGLSVSFGIVKDHNGTIQVESEPGHGCQFVIRLPELDEDALQPDLSADKSPDPLSEKAA